MSDKNCSRRKKLEFITKLSLLPDDKLDELHSLIDSILYHIGVVKAKPINPRGIWKGTGFEKILNRGRD